MKKTKPVLWFGVHISCVSYPDCPLLRVVESAAEVPLPTSTFAEMDRGQKGQVVISGCFSHNNHIFPNICFVCDFFDKYLHVLLCIDVDIHYDVPYFIRIKDIHACHASSTTPLQ